MTWDITEELLAVDEPNALADRVRARLQGGGPPPLQDDWRFTDAVERAALKSRDEPLRSRFASAVLRLLHDLAGDPDAGVGKGEWPAGLMMITRRTSFRPSELANVRRSLVSLLYYVRTARSWPLGRDTASGLGSATLELHRAARWADLDVRDHEDALQASIAQLGERYEEEADWELGALLGIKATYGETQAREAFRLLRGLGDEARRDRALYTMDQEYSRRFGSPEPLIKLLLETVGGVGAVVREANPPSPAEQRWAAEAARRLGEPKQDEQAMIARIEQPAAAPARTPRPGFAKAAASGGKQRFAEGAQ